MLVISFFGVVNDNVVKMVIMNMVVMGIWVGVIIKGGGGD